MPLIGGAATSFNVSFLNNSSFLPSHVTPNLPPRVTPNAGLLYVDRVLYSSVVYPHNYGERQLAAVLERLPLGGSQAERHAPSTTVSGSCV